MLCPKSDYMNKQTLNMFLSVSEGQRLVDALDEWREILTMRLIRRGRVTEALVLQGMNRDKHVRSV